MPSPRPSSGWDPVLLVSQIVSVQALHYLTLCILIPPLLDIFAEPNSLEYEGGASSVGMVMDWREMAGRPTVRGLWGDDRRGWAGFRGAYSGGRKVGEGVGLDWRNGDMFGWDGRMDPSRGWVIAFCWIAACACDIYYLYLLVRKPRLILDFSLTLVFNHIVLTTYYSEALPSSLFFWLVMAIGSALTVITAEQLCVKREMREGLAVASGNQDEELEMGLRDSLRD